FQNARGLRHLRTRKPASPVSPDGFTPFSDRSLVAPMLIPERRWNGAFSQHRIAGGSLRAAGDESIRSLPFGGSSSERSDRRVFRQRNCRPATAGGNRGRALRLSLGRAPRRKFRNPGGQRLKGRQQRVQSVRGESSAAVRK